MNKGLTFIELLVVVTLMGVIGAIVTQIFVLGLRSQVKTEIFKEVKQNGDYVVSVIEGMVRNAANISQIQCNENSDKLTIIGQDGLSTTFDCSEGTFASISGELEAVPTVSYSITSSKVTAQDCNFRVVCPTPPLSPKYVFVSFNISQSGEGLKPESRASFEYQTTISLRTYQ